MMLGNIGLFKGIMAKMDWLDQNQRVIAQNVANADTPDYQPMTLKAADFKSFLGRSAEKAGAVDMTPVRLQATDSKHFGIGAAGAGISGDEAKQRKIYEASPDENGVVIEEQLFRANSNATQYQIATDLYRRNAGMLRLVVQGGR